MKITHNKVGTNLNTSDAARAGGAAGADKAKAKGGDAKASLLDNTQLGAAGASQVNISQRAQEMKKIKEAAMAAPDVDEAKVARLQKLIDEGKYKVDAKDIADKMVDDQLSWE